MNDEALEREIVSPLVRAGFRYWASRRRDGKPPRRADIDPVDIPALLPNIILLDVLSEPLDFRYRLVGGNVRYHLNSNLHGLRMSEIPHQMPPSYIWSKCVQAVETPTPVLSNTPYVGPHRDFLRAEDLLLPLANDGGDVMMLLIFVAYLHKRDPFVMLSQKR